MDKYEIYAAAKINTVFGYPSSVDIGGVHHRCVVSIDGLVDLKHVGGEIAANFIRKVKGANGVKHKINIVALKRGVVELSPCSMEFFEARALFRDEMLSAGILRDEDGQATSKMIDIQLNVAEKKVVSVNERLSGRTFVDITVNPGVYRITYNAPQGGDWGDSRFGGHFD